LFLLFTDRAKIKKLFVSHTLPTVRKRCDSKYFLGDLRRLFFFFWLLEVPILFQNLCSELVYTFKWTKSVAWLWRNQICEWTLKKTKSPYLPTHRWNGGSGAGNEHIFKGGLVMKNVLYVYHVVYYSLVFSTLFYHVYFP
jgi:hypothetical protein